MKILKSKYSVLILIIILGVMIFAYCWQAEKALIKNHFLFVAQITGVDHGGRGDAGVISLLYTVNINGKNIQGADDLGENILSYTDAVSFLIGKTFPVIYEPKHPDNQLLLIRESDFKKFNVPFPDSLRWVKKYVK